MTMRTGRSRALWTGLLLSTAITLSAGACAQRSEVAPARRDRNVIGSQELMEVQERTTLRQVIQRLRPHWLSGRGPSSVSTDSPVIVYLNSSRISGDTLDRMVAAEVRELHFLDAINATQRFGTGHRSGAILIMMR